MFVYLFLSVNGHQCLGFDWDLCPKIIVKYFHHFSEGVIQIEGKMKKKIILCNRIRLYNFSTFPPTDKSLIM